MNAAEVIRQIIQGQKNLESMQGEIFTTLSTLLEIVLKQKRRDWPQNGTKVIRFKSKRCRWEIFSTTDSGGVSLRCWVKCGSSVWGEALAYSRRVALFLTPSFSQTEVVYDDLPAFVANMMKLFPFLEKAIEPILTASTKQF